MQVTQPEVRRRHGVLRQQRDGQSRVVGACRVHRRVEWAAIVAVTAHILIISDSIDQCNVSM